MGGLDFNSWIPDASRKTAILDTNLLILHITSVVDPGLMQTFKRVKNFTLQDVVLLSLVLGQFREVVTTSYVLTEASNLGNSLTGKLRDTWFQELASYARVYRETHVPTWHLGEREETVRFGFADSALSVLSEDYVVVTAEYRLSGYLEHRGAEVLNFNSLRPLWMLQ